MNSPANHQYNRIQQDLGGHSAYGPKLSNGEIGKFRSELLGSCPQFDSPAMAQFAVSCYESDAVIEAYFKTMHLPVLTRGRVLTGKTIRTVPFTHALRSARAAREMAIVRGDFEHHKKLLFLATMLAPAPLFLIALPAHRYVAGESKHLNQHLGELRSQVLLQPLQKLYKTDRESAALLATLLGFRSTISVDQELVSRMEAAVCLATLSVKTIWRATDPNKRR